MSELAKKVAGTFVEDGPAPNSALLRYFQTECRHGLFVEAVKEFARAQAEILDPALVLVEAVTSDSVTCSLPSRQYDHESGGTFPVEIKFALNPETGAATRLSF